MNANAMVCAVLCAVSGGADSVCLLHLVRSLGDVACFAAHFDHRLRESSASIISR